MGGTVSLDCLQAVVHHLNKAGVFKRSGYSLLVIELLIDLVLCGVPAWCDHDVHL